MRTVSGLVCCLLVVFARGSLAGEPCNCAPDQYGRMAVCSDGVPVHVSLTAPDVPLVGKVGKVTATVTVDYDLPDVTLKIELPTEGNVIAAPQLALGKLTKLTPVSRSFQVQFSSPGNKFVRAVVKAVEGPGMSWSAVTYLPLNIGAAHSRVGLDKSERPPEPVLVVPGDGRLIGRPSVESDSAVTPAPPSPLDTSRSGTPSKSASVNGTLGTLVITGRWTFADRYDWNYGQRYHVVELRQGVVGGHLAWAETDEDGNFTFPGITNPGATGVYVRCYSYSDHYGAGNIMSVIDLEGYEWADAYHRDTSTYVFADGTHSIGSWHVSFADAEVRAWWLLDDMVKAFGVPPDPSGRHVVEWSTTSEHGSHYHRGGNIHLLAGDADNTPDVVLHEMGHSVMYNIYGNHIPQANCPSPHYIQRESGMVCAWTEGWATAWVL